MVLGVHVFATQVSGSEEKKPAVKTELSSQPFALVFELEEVVHVICAVGLALSIGVQGRQAMLPESFWYTPLVPQLTVSGLLPVLRPAVED